MEITTKEPKLTAKDTMIKPKKRKYTRRAKKAGRKSAGKGSGIIEVKIEKRLKAALKEAKKQWLDSVKKQMPKWIEKHLKSVL